MSEKIRQLLSEEAVDRESVKSENRLARIMKEKVFI